MQEPAGEHDNQCDGTGWEQPQEEAQDGPGGLPIGYHPSFAVIWAKVQKGMEHSHECGP